MHRRQSHMSMFITGLEKLTFTSPPQLSTGEARTTEQNKLEPISAEMSRAVNCTGRPWPRQADLNGLD